MIHEGHHRLHNPIEKLPPFFRTGQLRVADRARFRDFVEFVHEINRPAVQHVGPAIDIGVPGYSEPRDNRILQLLLMPLRPQRSCWSAEWKLPYPVPRDAGNVLPE